jgi:hypothetical protein
MIEVAQYVMQANSLTTLSTDSGLCLSRSAKTSPSGSPMILVSSVLLMPVNSLSRPRFSKVSAAASPRASASVALAAALVVGVGTFRTTDRAGTAVVHLHNSIPSAGPQELYQESCPMCRVGDWRRKSQDGTMLRRLGR